MCKHFLHYVWQIIMDVDFIWIIHIAPRAFFDIHNETRSVGEWHLIWGGESSVWGWGQCIHEGEAKPFWSQCWSEVYVSAFQSSFEPLMHFKKNIYWWGVALIIILQPQSVANTNEATSAVQVNENMRWWEDNEIYWTEWSVRLPNRNACQ